MMTEVEFLKRFQPMPNGDWACANPIRINGPTGPFMIDEGAIFSPGILFMGLDLARELDQMAAKHRVPKSSVRAA